MSYEKVADKLEAAYPDPLVPNKMAILTLHKSIITTGCSFLYV